MFELFRNEETILEINIKARKPKNFEFHKLKTDKQYVFYAENGVGYHLSFKKSSINIKDKSIIEIYEKIQEGKGKTPFGYEFNVINFFFAGADPKSDSSHTDTTKSTKKEPEKQIGSLFSVGNMLWLWLDFMKRFPEEKCFAFAADDKRMNLYSNLFKILGNVFYIFPKKRYDKSYEFDQVLFIKK